MLPEKDGTGSSDETAARASTIIKIPSGLARIFTIGWGLLIVSFLTAGVCSLMVKGGDRTGYISFYLIGTYDFIWLGLAVLLFPGLWLLLRHRQAARLIGMHDLSAPSLMSWLQTPDNRKRAVLLLIAFTVLIIGTGTLLVYHGHALSVDEFMVRFQAAIFLHGWLIAPVSDSWISMTDALQPSFVEINKQFQFWVPGYRPGHSLLYAAFGLIGLELFVNTVLCGLCVWLIVLLARREWPDEPYAPILAAALLVVSPQFLVTGMTSYAMPAHLFASLLWLYCFTNGRLWGHAAAVTVGIFAIGLHQVHIHPAFALPFLVHLLFVERRWRLSLVYAVSYAAAVVLWTFWIEIAVWVHGFEPIASQAVQSGPPKAGTGDGAFYFLNAIIVGLSRHGWQDIFLWLTNTTQFVGWQNFALLILVMIGLSQWRDMPPRVRLLALSIASTLLPYILLMPMQGHGWGYRYLHPVLGNFVLIALFGFFATRKIMTAEIRARLNAFLLAASAVTVLIALPLRFAQVEHFVRPFAAAQSFISAQPHDFVIINTTEVWYGRDLVRNDPLLNNAPKVMDARGLSKAELRRLCQNHSSVYVDFETVSGLGVKPQEPRTEEAKAEATHVRDKMDAGGCAYLRPDAA